MLNNANVFLHLINMDKCMSASSMLYVYIYTSQQDMCSVFCFVFFSLLFLEWFTMLCDSQRKKKTKRTMECVYVVVQLCEIICQRKTGFEMVVVDQHRDGYLR